MSRPEPLKKLVQRAILTLAACVLWKVVAGQDTSRFSIEKIAQLLDLSDSLMKSSRFDSSYQLAGDVVNWSMEHQNDSMQLMALRLRILNAYYIYLPIEMVEASRQHLELSQKTGNKSLQGKSYNYLGVAFGMIGDNKNAYKYYHKALETGREIDSDELQAFAMENIGVLYYSDEEFDEARRFFKDKLKILKRNVNAQVFGQTYSNIGNSFFKQEQFDSALIWFEKADSMYRTDSTVTENFLISSRVNIASIFLQYQSYEKALEIYHQQLPKALAISDQNEEIVIYGSLADVYRSMGDTANFLKYLNLNIEKAREYHRKEPLKKALEKLLEYYQFTKNARGLELLDELSALQKELQEQDFNNTIDKVKLEFELEQKEVSISKLQSEKDLAELKLWIYAIVFTFLILLGLIVLFYQRRNLAKNKVLAEKEQKLQREKIRAQQTELEANKSKLGSFVHLLVSQNRIRSELADKMSAKIKDEDELAQVYASKILTKEDWEEFKSRFEKVFPNLMVKLKQQHADITPAEQRLFLLTKLHLSSDEIGNVLGISADSVRKTRLRLRKALKLESNKDLDEYISDFN